MNRSNSPSLLKETSFLQLLGCVALLVIGTGAFQVAESQTIVLQADNNNGHDNVWQKRADAGKQSWGIEGRSDGTVLSGNIWFNTFPGENGKYKVTFGVILEDDGDPEYKLSAGTKVLQQGRYSYPSGTRKCEGGTSKASTIDLGEQDIKKGDKITIWGRSVYYCQAGGKYHGAYTRWYEIRFEKVGGANNTDVSAPSAPEKVFASGIKTSSLKLSWDPAIDNESAIEKYTVYQDGKSIGTSAEEEFSVTNLSLNKMYKFQISATNKAQLESAKSKSLSITTLKVDLPPLVLTSPQGGEKWKIGTTVNIQWSAQDEVNEVLIALSPDTGKTWINITENSISRLNHPNQWEKWPWKIPAILTDENGKEISLASIDALYIRVSDYNLPELFTLNTQGFSVYETVSIRGKKSRAPNLVRNSSIYIFQNTTNKFVTLSNLADPLGRQIRQYKQDKQHSIPVVEQ